MTSNVPDFFSLRGELSHRHGFQKLVRFSLKGEFVGVIVEEGDFGISEVRLPYTCSQEFVELSEV
jgi:hypothetical protein